VLLGGGIKFFNASLVRSNSKLKLGSLVKKKESFVISHCKGLFGSVACCLGQRWVLHPVLEIFTDGLVCSVDVNQLQKLQFTCIES
jgi:hypothetical protein